MNSTPTPARIAFFSALIIAGFYAIMVGLLTKSLFNFALILLVGIAVGYATIYFFLERFIYDKIKLIYKSIHQLNTQHIKARRGKDPIASISEEVAQWANERREEIDELKKQEAYRREFVGNVSHELKTPIFQIQGYVHTLLEGALTDPEVNYRFLKKAAKSSDRLVELVDDLTSISQLESGEIEMHMTKFDLSKIVDEVYEELEFKAKEKQIKLTHKDGSDKHLKVKADKSRIKQVLTNLVSNGIKYGRKNGLVRCGIYDMDTYVLVEISDDGEGIPSVSLPRLFERFYRVEKSRNRDDGGSGLGLSIAKHLVEAHGQSIHVRSVLGEGSTFGFTLQGAKKG